MTMRELHVGHVPVRALRISYVGELGWELYAPTEFGLALWDTLWRGGRAARLGRACGGAAYDSLRLEKGYRLWGADIARGARPLGGRPRLRRASSARRDFLGRDAAARGEGARSRRAGCAA